MTNDSELLEEAEESDVPELESYRFLPTALDRRVPVPVLEQLVREQLPAYWLVILRAGEMEPLLLRFTDPEALEELEQQELARGSMVFIFEGRYRPLMYTRPAASTTKSPRYCFEYVGMMEYGDAERWATSPVVEPAVLEGLLQDAARARRSELLDNALASDALVASAQAVLAELGLNLEGKCVTSD